MKIESRAPDARKPDRVRFPQLLELAPDGILGVGRDGRIMMTNRRAETLFGYGRDELLGQPVELLVPERLRAKHASERGGYFADPRTRPMGSGADLRGRRKDGSDFPVDISLSSVDGHEGLVAIAAVRDVTARVQAAEAASLVAERERQGLEAHVNELQRLESVAQLAGGIAHDFNNILGVILNSADFVAEAIEPGSGAMEDVEEIRRAAERGAALTRQLLAFSRRDVTRPRVLDVNDLVTELDRLLFRALGEDVLLETRLARELWRVRADPGQLEQVLVNLAFNARDAMPRGGRLLVETANVVVDDDVAAADSGAAPGRYVRIAVTDTGAGMARDVAARAFEPFYTTKPKGSGTGLGLATVGAIVADAGGHIHLYSEPGVGTTVKVHLPATSGDAAVRARGREPKPRARGETVLLVEDEPSVKRVAKRILTGAGYNVVVADDGEHCLAICARADERVDLLLTDVVMPRMAGPELAERTVALRPDLTTVFMSGYASSPQREALGSAAFVEKPFTASTLLAAVRTALDRS